MIEWYKMWKAVEEELKLLLYVERGMSCVVRSLTRVAREPKRNLAMLAMGEDGVWFDEVELMMDDDEMSSDMSSFCKDGDSVDTSSVTENVIPAKKKRVRLNRKRYPAKHFPRIVKRDIRRLLPQMALNVLNDGALPLVRSFFETFGVPNFGFDEFRASPSTRQLERQMYPFPMSGLTAVLLTVGCNLILAPDSFLTIESAEIRQHSTLHNAHACEINMMVRCSGTRLFEFIPTSNTTELVTEVSGIERMLENRPLRALKEPQRVSAMVRVSFRLTEDHRICNLLGEDFIADSEIEVDTKEPALCIPLNKLIEQTGLVAAQ